MIKIDFNVAQFVKDLTDIQLRQMPFAVSQALNDTMFDIREGWATQMQEVFDRPTAFTMNSILYTKSTKSNLVAQVFIRNEASNGTPPAAYLTPEAYGGNRPVKPFENRLRSAGVLGSDEWIVPARGFPLDQFGNIPATIVKTILADLQALRDPQSHSSPQTRAKRSRRRIIASRATYFESAPALSASQGHHQPLPRGIYQKTRLASGSAVRMVMAIVNKAPRYNKRFDATAIAQKLFDANFSRHFRARLDLAVLGGRRV